MSKQTHLSQRLLAHTDDVQRRLCVRTVWTWEGHKRILNELCVQVSDSDSDVNTPTVVLDAVGVNETDV